MKKYLAILRGINVGGHNKILMSELITLFKELNFQEVRTYIQSGNVVFNSSGNESNAALEDKIRHAIETKFNLNIPIFVRSGSELKLIVSTNKFIQNEDITPEKLHVTFLSQKPEESFVDNLKTMEFPPDEFYVSGQEIYIHCPDKYGETKLSNLFFEKKLKVVATTRNWKTVNQLLKMLQN